MHSGNSVTPPSAQTAIPITVGIGIASLILEGRQLIDDCNLVNTDATDTSLVIIYLIILIFPN